LDVLYLSYLYSKKEYERLFKKFSSTSSHSGQKFHWLSVQGLTQNGCHVDALSQRLPVQIDKEEHKRPEETENGIHYKYLPCYKNTLLNRFMVIFNGCRYICKWHRLHKDGIAICDIDVGEFSIALWIASRFFYIKKVAYVTDVPSIRAGEKRKGIRTIPYRIKNSLIQQYNGYVFLTEQMNRVLNRKNKPYIVIEGIVDEHVVDQPNTLEGKYPAKVCMMAGVLQDIFGVDDLLQAFTKVEDPEARLVLYGTGPSVETIHTFEKMDPRIRYGGELLNTQIVSEEKKATLLINPRPPLEEWTAFSFPSKNMEYIASGTPMLAFYLPSIPEEYMQYSFYITETDDKVEQIKQMLEKILGKDKKELFRIGMEAQAWIVKNKNAGMQTNKIVELMSKMANQRGLQ